MFKRYDWTSAEYADAFHTLLSCSAEVETRRTFIQSQIEQQSPRNYAVDWGAGSGDLTELLLGRFANCAAVEPAEEMRKILRQRFPSLDLLDGDLSTAQPDEELDFGLMSHVLYHIPDEHWLSLTLRVASFLSRSGVLVVLLKNAESGCNRMLQHFGAPAFDLVKRLSAPHAERDAFDFSFQRLPAGIQTNTFEDTTSIARFMMCDRDAEDFDDSLSEQAFQDYVQEHFWDSETNTGSWNYQLVACLVTRQSTR